MTCSPRTGTSTNGAASDTHDLPVRGSKKQSLADGSYPFAFGLISYPCLPSTTTWIWQDRTLFGCLPEQFRSLLVRPWDTVPVEVHHTEIVLGIGCTFIRQLGEDTGCLGENLSTPFPKRYAHALSNLPSVIVHKPSSPRQDTRTAHPENVRGCVPPTSSVYTHKSIEWPEVIL